MTSSIEHSSRFRSPHPPHWLWAKSKPTMLIKKPKGINKMFIWRPLEIWSSNHPLNRHHQSSTPLPFSLDSMQDKPGSHPPGHPGLAFLVVRVGADAEELNDWASGRRNVASIDEALRLCTITVCPDTTGQRAAALIGLGRLGEAVGECTSAPLVVSKRWSESRKTESFTGFSEFCLHAIAVLQCPAHRHA
jgi:hypothetical protein